MGAALTRRLRRPFGDNSLVAVLLTGAETALLHLLVAEIAGSWGKAPLGWAALWAVGLLAYFLPRALEGLPSRAYALLLASVITATSLLAAYAAGYRGRAFWDPSWAVDAARALMFIDNAATRSIPLLAAALGALWWRQTHRETPGSEAAGAVFRLGPVPVAFLMLGALAAWGVGRELETATLRVAAFFLLALLALACTRWLETPQRGPGGRSTLPSWLGASTLPLLAAMLLTAGLSALLLGTAGPLLDLAATALVSVAVLLVVAVSTVLVWVAWALSRLLLLVLSIFNVHPQFGRLPGTPAEAEGEDRVERVTGTIQASEWLLWVLLALAVLLVLYALTRYRPRREDMSGEAATRESIWERPHLGRGLRNLLRRMRPRDDDPLRALLRDPRWRHTAEVRRAYRDVQRLYARAGKGRDRSQTAREHASAQGAERLDELAAVYQRARYSTRPAPPEEAERARRLRAASRAELDR